MIDIGDYCRQVEAHLTRVNGGHLVRIVGPGFMLVRQWAEDGVPLSAVFRGIEQKAERHKAGAARRPLRIEFCEADVRDVFETWRRAIGVVSSSSEAGASVATSEVDRGSGSGRRHTTRALERAIDRLVATAGRLEWPESFRSDINGVLDRLVALRDAVKGTRGVARDELLARLPDLDQTMMSAARAAMPGERYAALREEAASDLAPFRSRLAADAWEQAIDVTADRAVRAFFGLPDLEHVAE